MEQDPRPIYRHIIVKRRRLIERAATPDQARRLRAYITQGASLDEDLEHLVIKDSLKKTMRNLMNSNGHFDVEVESSDSGIDPSGVFLEMAQMKERGETQATLRYQPQEGVVVSRVVQEHMPGGGQLLSQPKVLFHQGFAGSENPALDFLKCAQELSRMFDDHSDLQVMLLDATIRASVTLVTVVETPIIAVPREHSGVELLCEFHQKTVMGHVDTTGFEVYSEVGEYPISIPNDLELVTMMKTADEWKSSVGA